MAEDEANPNAKTVFPEGRTRSTAQANAEGLRLFIAGLPWKLDEVTVRRDFEECGIIEDLFLLRDSAGVSKGRAFITFRDKEAAEAALLFNNTSYGGRKIFVNKAEEKKKEDWTEKQDEKPPEKLTKPKADNKPEGCVSLCLKNTGEATDAEIREWLDGVSVQAVRVVYDRTTGDPRGIAFVDFPNSAEVDKAMAFNRKELKEYVVEMFYELPKVRPRPEGCMSVAIKKLDPKTTDADVKKLLSGLESLKEVRVIRENWGMRCCKGFAFAEFGKEADVEAAIRRDGMSVRGSTVFICYETKQKKERADAQAADEPAKKKQKVEAGGSGEITTKTIAADKAAKLKEITDNDAALKKEIEKKLAKKLKRKKNLKAKKKADKVDKAEEPKAQKSAPVALDDAAQMAALSLEMKKKKKAKADAAVAAPEPAAEEPVTKKKKKRSKDDKLMGRD